MLTEFTIENFKSYRSSTIYFAPLTLMIGANASGKSNAIEGLRFLSWVAQDHKLSSIRYELQQGDDLLRGTIRDLPRFHTSHFSFRCRTGLPQREMLQASAVQASMRYLHSVLKNTLEIQFGIVSDELRILDERMRNEKEKVPLYEVKQKAQPPSSDMVVAYDNFARGGKKPQIICSDQQAVFLQLQSAARFEAGHSKAQRTIPQVAAAYQNLLADILFLDPAPRLMRSYSYPDPRLHGDGRNLSGVLQSLCENKENRGMIVRMIASLPEQNFREINFIKTPRGEYMLQLVESFGGVDMPVDASLLSDGTLRVLAVATALLSAPAGSMVVIEEIDNGVHPSRARDLMSSIREIATKKYLRVLLTTHNPALMDAIPDAALGDVVFCFREPETGMSEMVRLSDVERMPSLLAQGSLGDWVTDGRLERFVKSSEDEEENIQKSLSWLDSIKDS